MTRIAIALFALTLTTNAFAYKGWGEPLFEKEGPTFAFPSPSPYRSPP